MMAADRAARTAAICREIRTLREATAASIYEIAKVTEAASRSVSSWMRGRCLPSGQALALLEEWARGKGMATPEISKELQRRAEAKAKKKVKEKKEEETGKIKQPATFDESAGECLLRIRSDGEAERPDGMPLRMAPEDVRRLKNKQSLCVDCRTAIRECPFICRQKLAEGTQFYTYEGYQTRALYYKITACELYTPPKRRKTAR